MCQICHCSRDPHEISTLCISPHLPGDTANICMQIHSECSQAPLPLPGTFAHIPIFGFSPPLLPLLLRIQDKAKHIKGKFGILQTLDSLWLALVSPSEKLIVRHCFMYRDTPHTFILSLARALQKGFRIPRKCNQTHHLPKRPLRLMPQYMTPLSPETSHRFPDRRVLFLRMRIHIPRIRNLCQRGRCDQVNL